MQYSPEAIAIRAQTVYVLHSTMPSVTCLRLSDVSVICRVTYFQFPSNSVCVSSMYMSSGAPALWRTVGLLRNIGHRTLPKFWVGTFLVQNVHPRGKTLN